MQSSSASTQDPGNLFSLVSKLSYLAFESRLKTRNSDGYSSILPNCLCFNGVKKNSRVVASLSLSGGSGCSNGNNIRKLFNEFNKFARFHCEKIPIGFASLRVGPSDDVNGLGEDGCSVLENEGLPLNGVGLGRKKKVLILMSDTGGGHRASAEAIKAAFNEEFGDEYEVSFDCLISMME